MPLRAEQFICREDNFAVILHDEMSGKTLAIDAPDGEKMLAFLQAHGWGLDLLLITHHHSDHTAGIDTIKRAMGTSIIGPKREANKIAGLDILVDEGDRLDFGGSMLDVISTPGHTAGAVSYHMPQDGLVFTGDTLFSLGCGRLFECSPEIMLTSLKKLQKLPPETKLYCGHEYTKSNGHFALNVDATNEALKRRLLQVDEYSTLGRPALPSTIGQELQTNPFLRYDDPHIVRNLGLEGSDDVTVFTELRRRKDIF